MTRLMHFAAPLFVLAIVAPSAHAQRAQPENATAVTIPEVMNERPALSAPRTATGTNGAEPKGTAGPTLAGAAAGVRTNRAAVATGSPAPLVPREKTTQNRAMIIVGAAGLIVGAIIGDTAGTLIMVASAGVGLYGLYKYLE